MAGSPTESDAPIAGPVLRSPSIKRRPLLLIGLGGIAVIALFGILMIAKQSQPTDVVKALVGSLVTRDVAAAQYLSDASMLPEIARSMGIEALPASVKIAGADLQVRPVETGREGVGEVVATWTLTATGDRSHAAQAAQEATITLATNPAGRWVVTGWDITPALEFDLAGYFGSTGTTVTDRDQALADLQKGMAWLGAVTAQADDARTDVTADPIYTDDPDALDTQVTTTSEGVVGQVTHWGVRFAGAEMPSFQVSEAKTRQEVPTRIRRGVLTTDGVISDATTWINSWVRGVQGGDATALASATDAAVVSAAAWQRMQVDGLQIPAQAEPTLVSDNPLSVAYGPITVIRQAGGGWKVDTAVSLLMHDWLAAVGAPINVHANPAAVDLTNCGGSLSGANVRVRLDGVALYGDNRNAVAVFRFDATDDLNCSDGVPIDELAVTWNGHMTAENLFPQNTSDEGARTYLQVDLPSGIDAQAAPIKVDVTINTVDFFGYVVIVGGQSIFTAGG